MQTVGLLVLYRRAADARFVFRALKLLGVESLLILHPPSDPLWREKISSSSVRKWICTGSDTNVYEKDAVQLKALPFGKEYFLICYSMQSFLHYELGLPITEMPEKVQEAEVEEDGSMIWRNHRWAFKKVDVDSYERAGLLQGCKYSLVDGYLMEAACAPNIWMTQHHPERVLDGLEMIQKFIGKL